MESVKLVFDYFCERTPQVRLSLELRETERWLWNYKYADVEFGRACRRATCCSTSGRDLSPMFARCRQSCRCLAEI